MLPPGGVGPYRAQPPVPVEPPVPTAPQGAPVASIRAWASADGVTFVIGPASPWAAMAAAFALPALLWVLGANGGEGAGLVLLAAALIAASRLHAGRPTWQAFAEEELAIGRGCLVRRRRILGLVLRRVVRVQAIEAIAPLTRLREDDGVPVPIGLELTLAGGERLALAAGFGQEAATLTWLRRAVGAALRDEARAVRYSP